MGPLLHELSTLEVLGGRDVEVLAEGAGRALATSLVLRLSGGDEAVGGIAGTVLFNVALTYVTDGAFLAAKAVLPGLVTLVTATRDAATVAEDLGRWLPQVLQGLEVAGGRLTGAVAERVQRVLDTLKPLVEGLLAMAKRTDKGDDPAVGAPAHGSGTGSSHAPHHPDPGHDPSPGHTHDHTHDSHQKPPTDEEAVAHLKLSYTGRVSGLQTRVFRVSEWVDHVPAANPSRRQWVSDIANVRDELGTVRDLIEACRTRQELESLESLILDAEPKLTTLEREVPRHEPAQVEQPDPARERSRHPANQEPRSLRVRATVPQARLIENPARRFLPDVVDQIDEAQITMNDLYRAGSKYGDGSSAFMAMLEQFRVGAGHAPVPIAGDTLHYGKCGDYIVALAEKIKLLTELPEEAKQRLALEIQRMEEARHWAVEYFEGNDPPIPRWAKPWASELER